MVVGGWWLVVGSAAADGAAADDVAAGDAAADDAVADDAAADDAAAAYANTCDVVLPSLQPAWWLDIYANKNKISE